MKDFEQIRNLISAFENFENTKPANIVFEGLIFEASRVYDDLVKNMTVDAEPDAPVFKNSNQYRAGTTVMHDGKTFKAKVDIPPWTGFDSKQWTEVVLTRRSKALLNELISYLHKNHGLSASAKIERYRDNEHSSGGTKRENGNMGVGIIKRTVDGEKVTTGQKKKNSDNFWIVKGNLGFAGLNPVLISEKKIIYQVWIARFTDPTTKQPLSFSQVEGMSKQMFQSLRFTIQVERLEGPRMGLYARTESTRGGKDVESTAIMGKLRKLIVDPSAPKTGSKATDNPNYMPVWWIPGAPLTNVEGDNVRAKTERDEEGNIISTDSSQWERDIPSDDAARNRLKSKIRSGVAVPTPNSPELARLKSRLTLIIQGADIADDTLARRLDKLESDQFLTLPKKIETIIKGIDFDSNGLRILERELRQIYSSSIDTTLLSVLKNSKEYQEDPSFNGYMKALTKGYQGKNSEFSDFAKAYFKDFNRMIITIT